MQRTHLFAAIVSLLRLLGQVDDYAGDDLEYNISTCIPERLATPRCCFGSRQSDFALQAVVECCALEPECFRVDVLR